MNCFEVRKNFVNFWRRELATDQRTTFVTHLRDCTRCDRAFRIFAISAPVLQQDEDRSNLMVPRLYDPAPSVPGSGAVARDEADRRHRWVAASAALATVAAASFAAYLSVTTPVRSLVDELTESEEPATQLFGSELSPASYDLAG